MKFLNSYKLFESTQDEISKYLEILGTDKDDINYIFIDLIDARYEIKYKLFYLDKDGNYNRERRKTCTPCVMIDIDKPGTKYVGTRQKFKNTEFLFTLYACVDRFIKMFSDKCDIEYSIGSDMDIEIKCEFPIEEDSNKVELSESDFLNAVRNAIDESTPEPPNISNHYQNYRLNDSSKKYIGGIKPSNVTLIAEEIYKNHTNKEELPSNWEECNNIKENLLNNLKSQLSEKLPNCQIKLYKELSTSERSKLDHDNNIYYIKNGEINKLIKVSCYNDDLGPNYITVGKIFKKTVPILIFKVCFEFELV